jgi:carbamoyl-phosphate synthase small subunit
MKALLMLEDGWYTECESFTGNGEVFGELVFNTGLTGYQEILTDPSYTGQIVLMTNTMIGNYGIRENEDESTRIHAEGFVVREYSGETLNTEATQVHSHGTALPTFRRRELKWASETLHNRIFSSLADYLNIQNVLGVEGVDTRALTKHIREQGAMTAGITTQTLDRKSFLEKVRKAPSIVGRNLVSEVTVQEPYLYYDGRGPRIIVLDCGVKVSSLRELAQRGCRVEVFPSSCDRADILEAKPDGILLSNGPGDPTAVPDVVSLVKGLIGEVPIFGICLGHQMIGQALGGKTFKLKFGHHGGNHPVRDERTGKVYITTQNHGFNVDTDTLDTGDIEKSFINLNDQTLEGLIHCKYPLFSVQFHPEAGPGPRDTMFLFDEFIDLIEKG